MRCSFVAQHCTSVPREYWCSSAFVSHTTRFRKVLYWAMARAGSRRQAGTLTRGWFAEEGYRLVRPDYAGSTRNKATFWSDPI